MGHDITIRETADNIADAVLREQFLEKKKLSNLVAVHIKLLMTIKVRPAYDKIKKPSAAAKYLRRSEELEASAQFWKEKCGAMCGTYMKEFYAEHDQHLKEKGFRS